MDSSVETDSSRAVFESEQNTIMERCDEKGTPAQVQEIEETHPRDGMPEWKWATTKLVICLLSLIYGYDIGNVANIQADIYKAFGQIDVLPSLSYTAALASPVEVAQIMGLIGMCYSLGLIAGPVIGGAFAQNIHATWRWAFYINLPIAGACLLAVIFLMPSYKAPSILSATQRLWKIDLIGSVLHAVAVVMLNIALTLSGAFGRYTILFLTAGIAALVGGVLLAHQVAITTSESHVMGYEAIIAFGVGLGLTHGMSVANTVLPREHRFDAAALMNMAQIGSIAIILGVAGCVFQNVGMNLLESTVATYEAETGIDLNLTSHDLRQALGGLASPLWESGNAEFEYFAVEAVTRTITRIFNVILAAGAVCIAGALLMRWEKLEFKAPESMTMSSSSSATTALSRSRSLRQPTAGLNRTQKKDETGKDTNNKDATATAPARTTSPTRLPKPGGSTIASRKRAGTVGTGTGNGNGNGIPSTTTATNPSAAGTKPRPVSGVFGRLSTVAANGHQDDQADKADVQVDIHILEALTNLLQTTTYSHLPTPVPRERDRELPDKDTATTNERTYPREVDRNGPHLSDDSAPPAAALSRIDSLHVHHHDDNYSSNSSREQEAHSPVQHPNTSSLSRSSTTTAARSTRPGATDDAPRLRPAFSTLQQHYSPARNVAPKPLTSSILAPPSPSRLPANVAISSETARLQTELLQLHLLHRDADAVTAEWHASARERLGCRFAELAGADAEVGRAEAEAVEARNLAALEAWGGGRGLEDKIQILDSVVSGVWSLGEPGGRYARVVRQFEKWTDRMVQSVEARRKAGGLGALMDDDKVAFVGELDPAWKDEVASVSRKLDLWRRQLTQLGDGLPRGRDDEVQQQSSLARILSGCRGQVGDMLAELSVMEQIERDAIAQETAWIRRMNCDDDENDTPRAGAIWRAL
ncbi:hypothetical protein VMCG_00482 [Cytospora schulzeri]|uniref:Major facilitator superfamily (MFS) profile domain-containing protein n=1 Tax=Cytospora schulzeri TaxID=448051 RepID=A0A423XAC9_9PEZI|nr:hypothetical protein VMCG_00482 [Valsa malicola]